MNKYATVYTAAMNKVAAGEGGSLFGRFNNWLSDKIVASPTLRKIVAPSEVNKNIAEGERRLASANIGNLNEVNNQYFNQLMANKDKAYSRGITRMFGHNNKIAPMSDKVHPMQQLLQAGEHAPAYIHDKPTLKWHVDNRPLDSNPPDDYYTGTEMADTYGRTLPNRPVTNMELEWARRKYAPMVAQQSGFQPNTPNYNAAVDYVTRRGKQNYSRGQKNVLYQNRRPDVEASEDLQKDPRFDALALNSNTAG